MISRKSARFSRPGSTVQISSGGLSLLELEPFLRDFTSSGWPFDTSSDSRAARVAHQAIRWLEWGDQLSRPRCSTISPTNPPMSLNSHHRAPRSGPFPELDGVPLPHLQLLSKDSPAS